MNISMILEMAASSGDRPAVTAEGRSLTASALLRLAHAAADRFRATRPSTTWAPTILPTPSPSSGQPWRVFPLYP